MKINKITAALAGLGVVSLAGVVHANTTIYLTGSTAARAYIYAMATTTSDLFSSPATVVAGVNANSSNQIVFEGSISGVSGTVDLSCDFTGSEAGIASVAGQNLTQDIPNNPNLAGTGTDQSTYPLPGVNAAAAFFQPNGIGGWNNPAALPGGTFPDLTMADTSQAVSRTPNTGATQLHDYGAVGAVPFTFAKGFETGADSSWTHCVNITTAQINQALSANGALLASYLTGQSGDTDPVVIVGRNFGSGTRVNTFLNAAAYPLLTTVGQYAWNAGYPVTGGAGPEGTLTFGMVNGPGTGLSATSNGVANPFAPGGALVSVGNDGWDGGGNVQACLNVDGNPTASIAANGTPVLMIGYVGISDAQNALGNKKGGAGDAVALTFNGVYESDANVENGSYPYWGQEHLLGSAAAFTGGTTASSVGTKLDAAITSFIGTVGSATGDINSNPSGQSLLVPFTKMNVSRTSDSGYPTQN